MNEIKELTLEILKHTQISDVEMAEETAEIIINTLGYHKKTEKVSPEAIALADDLATALPSCNNINCAECRYKEFAERCVMVKHAESLIKLGWTKEIKDDHNSLN